MIRSRTPQPWVLLACLVSALAGPAGCGGEDPPFEDMRLAVHFKPPAGWPLPPTVSWKGDGLTNAPAWPGLPLVAEGNGWYGLELGEIGSVEIVFSTTNGDRQSAVYPFEDRGWFVPTMEAGGRWHGQWYDRNPDLFAFTPANAFLVVNSWGVGGWEKVPDGKYWITFDAVRQAKNFYAVFYEPRPVAEPTHLLVAGVAHPQRGRLRIEVRLQGAALSKAWPAWDAEYGHAGLLPLPEDNRLAIDVSEFAAELPGRALVVRFTDLAGQAGEVRHLSLERHDTYDHADPAPVASIAWDGVLPAVIPAGGTLELVLSNAGETDAAAVPAGKRDPPALESLVESTPPSDAEFENLRRVVGTTPPGATGNTPIGGRGTGLRPPTAAEWAGLRTRLRIARRVSPALVRNPRAATCGVDLSASPHFPPIGDQGAKGSCSAWAIGYYMSSFFEARQRGRDLSTIRWDGIAQRPDSRREWITSPQFLYIQLNDGNNNMGSSPFAIADLIAGIGTSSWATCPYNPALTDYLWPDETAWREAPRYRGRLDTSEDKWGTPHFLYFEDIDGYSAPGADGMLEILRTLLQNGIPVMVAIDANQFPRLSKNDVWTATAYKQTGYGNHANTLVGYGYVTP